LKYFEDLILESFLEGVHLQCLQVPCTWSLDKKDEHETEISVFFFESTWASFLSKNHWEIFWRYHGLVGPSHSIPWVKIHGFIIMFFFATLKNDFNGPRYDMGMGQKLLIMWFFRDDHEP